jgi:hypothetical protein
VAAQDGGGSPLGRFRRMLRPFTAGPDELEAAELQDSAGKLGAKPVPQCADRERVRVCGLLKTVTLRPRAGVPALEADLWDGAGMITLVWLGRRRVGGVEPGRKLVARGRVSSVDGRRVIFNPEYELLAPSAE